MGAPEVVAHAATAAEVVKTAQGTSIATGIWTLVGMAVMGVVTTIGVWIKWGPTWKKTEMDGEEKLRSEMWRDIDNLKTAKEDQGRRLALAEAALVSNMVEMGQLRFLLKMMSDELDRVAPGNPVSTQVKDQLIAMQRIAIPTSKEINEVADNIMKAS